MANKVNVGETSKLVYKVRLPKNNKKFSLLKIPSTVDFTKETGRPVKIERENNFKEFKLSNDIETQPKFGAGSEFGREQKEEARRKMLGFARNKYNPDNQPWIMNIGQSKNTKKFIGKKNAPSTQASYYIFCQTQDGFFDAFPLGDWYTFTPQIKYNYLTSEEAEEEFLKRDKRLNHFNIMTLKKLNSKKVDEEEEDEKEKKISKKVKGKDNKSFRLTEMDEWSDGNESAGNDSDEDKIGTKDSDDDMSSKKKKLREGASKKKEKAMDGSADEDSDDINEGEELDYITDTDSEDEDMYTEKVKSEKYEMKGVEEEEGMRKILDSDDEEEEEKKENEDEPEVDETKIKKEGDSSSESSGDSGSDSDIDKEPLPSALLMQQKKKKGSNENTPSSSRSATPTNEKDKKKRKNDEAEDTAAKRSRTNTPTPPLPSPSAALFTASDGVTEEAVRRYLMRKPMTVKDLMIKLHKNSGIPKDQVANTVGSILKKINPEKVKTGDKLYFHLKKN